MQIKETTNSTMKKLSKFIQFTRMQKKSYEITDKKSFGRMH